METNWAKITKNGSTLGEILWFLNTAKVKLYKHKNSDFVRIHELSNNYEYIHKYKDNLVQPGIFRDLFTSGDTSIGFKYFRREGGVDQYYRLYRHASGKISYIHKIVRNNKWELITEYTFDENDLSWSKTK